MGPFMTELFPTAVRGDAQGFCYNSGRAIGVLLPDHGRLMSARASISARRSPSSSAIAVGAD